MIVYENLSPEHLLEWGETDYPHPSRILGFACRRDDRLVAVGMFYVDDDDRWWGCFGSREGFPAGIHRKALEVIRVLNSVGVREMWARLDRDVPAARDWLVRLGFEPVDSSEEEWRRGLCS